ncbi:MAG: cell division protein FtsQ/DivIB [Jatrophihabitantaceae bacterium]
MSATVQSRVGDPAPAPREVVPRRKLILAAAGVIVVVALLTWLFAFSAVFGVRTVSVHGTRTLTVDQVRAAAKIADGTPLLRLDKAAVVRRVEALPDVASASISTSFPSSVLITVTERAAIGYVKTGSGFALVDRTGDQFRSVASAPKHLPLFVVPSGTGARTTGGAVATVAAALPASIRAKVSSIQALDPESITLLLTDQRVVRWGSADRSADKARILPALLKQPGTQFDLTDPDQPFAR